MGTKDVLDSAKAVWQKRIEEHKVAEQINPFSGWWGENRQQYKEVLKSWDGVAHQAKLTQQEKEYGHCKKGSETERRVKKAKDFITGNIIDLCHIIQDRGRVQEDGTMVMTFGELFKAYETINDKVVGLLCRARKHGLLTFPGEMLYQRQDEDVEIRLFKVPEFHELELKYVKFEGEKQCEENGV